MNESLGSFLRKIRKERNLTLRAVEERTRISNAYLSQLENDRIASPSPKILFELAKCYKLSYEKLMSLAGHPTPSEKELNPAFRLQDSFNELTIEEKERVLEYIRFLKSRKKVE